MKNVILVAVLVVIVGLAVWYVYRQKKKGVTCIGCPHAEKCSGKCNPSDEP